MAAADATGILDELGLGVEGLGDHLVSRHLAGALGEQGLDEGDALFGGEDLGGDLEMELRGHLDV